MSRHWERPAQCYQCLIIPWFPSCWWSGADIWFISSSSPVDDCCGTCSYNKVTHILWWATSATTYHHQHPHISLHLEYFFFSPVSDVGILRNICIILLLLLLYYYCYTIMICKFSKILSFSKIYYTTIYMYIKYNNTRLHKAKNVCCWNRSVQFIFQL